MNTVAGVIQFVDYSSQLWEFKEENVLGYFENTASLQKWTLYYV